MMIGTAHLNEAWIGLTLTVSSGGKSLCAGAMQICKLQGLCRHCVHRLAGYCSVTVLGKPNSTDLYRNA